MRLPTRHALLGLALLATSACAQNAAVADAELTRAGEAVRVTENPETVRGCEYVAEVVGPEGGNELRNEAARLGANFVLRVQGPTPRTEAYLCAD